MYLVWIAVILVGLKFAEVGPVADLSWWWVLAPLVIAFVWFEWVEKMFGLDKRQADHLEWEERRKARVAEQFPTSAKARRRA